MKQSVKFLILLLSVVGTMLRADVVFSIGKPDARSAEFSSFDTEFNTNFFHHPEGTNPFKRVKEFFAKPFVFDVAKHSDADFPFVQPVRRCEWADISFQRPPLRKYMYFVQTQYSDSKAKYHPLGIKFSLKQKPEKNLFLKIGFTDKAPFFSNGTGVEVGVNGAKVSDFQIPYFYDSKKNPYPCFSTMTLNPKSWGVPVGQVVEIPAKFLKEGENIISLKGLSAPKYFGEEWFTYDYIQLADSPELPVVENPQINEAQKAMDSLDFSEVVFAMRGKANDAHWYGSFGFYPDAKIGYTKQNTPLNKLKYSNRAGMMAINPPDARDDSCAFPRQGGKLSVINLKTGAVRDIISDSTGDVRNPSVNFESSKIMYSYRKGDEDTFNIYECNIDGSAQTLHSLSDKMFDDFESTYLPNGDIVFISTRCERTVPCWMLDVGIMYRWFADENVVRPISANVDQDNSPYPTSDGNIIYMKWEYVHKSQHNFHHLWKKSPDASNDMVYFGNDIPGHLFIDPKEVEGEPNKFVFTFINDHGDRDHRGRVAMINAPANPGDYKAFRFITGQLKSRWLEGEFPYNSYTSPCPVGKNYILAVSEGKRIVLMDYQGHILKYFDLPKSFKAFPKTHILEMFPIRPRVKGLSRPDMADYSEKEATVVLVDAAIGRNLGNLKKGETKKLLVTEILPNLIHLYGGTEPFSLRGAFSYERYLGTVDVEPDGSAHFKVPAGRALSFTSLDKNGNAIKRMHSFTMFAPGTMVSCIGCHENRDMAPPPITGKLLALKRAPDSLKPVSGVPQGDVVDFVRDIQPILSKHCVKCHNSTDFKAKVDLSEGHGAMMPISYFYLRTRRQIYDGYNLNGNFPIYTFGSGGSDIMKKVDGSHHDVKLSQEEVNRLKIWLDTGGTASESNACWQAGVLRYYYSNVSICADENWGEVKEMAKVIKENCASCHTGEKSLPTTLSGADYSWSWLWNVKKLSPKNRLCAHTVFNTKHPENSSILMAPLAQEAGGRACKGGHSIIFKDKNDHRYKTILSAIIRAKKYIDEENPHYTSPNYEPKGAYLGALIRRGIIKEGDNLKNFDAFKADKKYWEKVTGK